MKTCYLDMTAEFLVEVTKGFRVPLNSSRRFAVMANPLPDDAELVSVESLPNRVIRLWIRSRLFEVDGACLDAPLLRCESQDRL